MPHQLIITLVYKITLCQWLLFFHSSRSHGCWFRSCSRNLFLVSFLFSSSFSCSRSRSHKQLYKRCAKSMGRPKFRPLLLPHFSTDFNETQNQERYPGYDPTCKIWLMWDDGKGVCVGREFSIAFCVLTILFLYSCSRLQVTPEDRSRPFMAQNACFCVRYPLL